MGDNNSSNDTDLDKQSPTLDTSTSQSAIDLEQGTHTATTPVHLPIQEPKDGKKPLIWVLVILIVLALVGGGFYYFMSATKSDNNATATPTTTPVASASPAPVTGAEQTVAAIKKLLKGTAVTGTKIDSYGAADANNYPVYELASYTVDKNDYATQPSKGFGVAVSSSDNKSMIANYQAVTDYLEKQKFTKKDNQTTPSGPVVASALYTSSDMVCAVSERSYATIETTAKVPYQYAVAVGCADMSEYKKAAEIVKPFAAAVNKASTTTGDMPLSQYSADVAIHDGTDGYKNASVRVDAGTALFYQEPGKDWVRWIFAGDMTTACTEFTTTILKKAFANEDCLDKKTNRTVKVSTLS